MISTIKTKLSDPAFMEKFHFRSAIFWFCAAFPIMLFLSSSVPFLVFVSIYAIVTGHWSANQSAEGEKRTLGMLDTISKKIEKLK